LISTAKFLDENTFLTFDHHFHFSKKRWEKKLFIKKISITTKVNSMNLLC